MKTLIVSDAQVSKGNIRSPFELFWTAKKDTSVTKYSVSCSQFMFHFKPQKAEFIYQCAWSCKQVTDGEVDWETLSCPLLREESYLTRTIAISMNDESWDFGIKSSGELGNNCVNRPLGEYVVWGILSKAKWPVELFYLMVLERLTTASGSIICIAYSGHKWLRLSLNIQVHYGWGDQHRG